MDKKKFEKVIDTVLFEYRIAVGLKRRQRLEFILKELDIDYEISRSIVNDKNYVVEFKCLLEDYVKVMKGMAIDPDDLLIMYYE